MTQKTNLGQEDGLPEEEERGGVGDRVVDVDVEIAGSLEDHVVHAQPVLVDTLRRVVPRDDQKVVDRDAVRTGGSPGGLLHVLAPQLPRGSQVVGRVELL